MNYVVALAPLALYGWVRILAGAASIARFALSARRRLEWRDQRSIAFLNKELPPPCEVLGHEFTYNETCDWCDERRTYCWTGNPVSVWGGAVAWQVDHEGHKWWTLASNVKDSQPTASSYIERPCQVDAEALLWSPGTDPRKGSSWRGSTTPKAVMG